MKKYLPWLALPLLLAALLYALRTHTVDQSLVQDCYRALLPEATSFEPLTDAIAAARDASGATLGYVGVSSHVGYGGPMLVGVVVRPDGSLEEPVIFSHKETQAYLHNIKQQGFFRQFETRRADDALTPGFDVDAVSGATLSSNAVALSVNEVAHTVATQALELTPRKAELPVRMGIPELVLVALFVLGLLASTFKKLAKYRLLLLIASIVILGFWLNRFPENTEEESRVPSYGTYNFSSFPWFAVLFIACIGINSLGIIPKQAVSVINSLDIFMLTMAMCALGMETSLEKVRMVGPKPFLLAGVLALWLIGGGYFVTRFILSLNF